MIHLVEPTAPTPSATSQATPAGSSEPREAQVQENPDPVVENRPEPIALNVQRGESGVFVYTLSDPSTGRLVAVIPDTQSARTAGNYVSGGWVSLTA